MVPSIVKKGKYLRGRNPEGNPLEKQRREKIETSCKNKLSYVLTRKV